MNHTNGNRSSFTRMIGGLALGALAMYMFDPVQGNRRRALVRDKLNSMKARSGMADEAGSPDAGDRAQSVAVEVRRTPAGATDSASPAPDTMSQSCSAP